MRALLGVVAVAISLSCFAQSNQPAPSSGKDIQKQQPPTPVDATKSSNARSDGFEPTPSINKQASAISQEEAEHKRYERHEKPTLDRWLTWATVFLALVTAALAGFTYLLWAATGKLVREAKATSQMQLRAYVGIKSCAVIAHEDEDRFITHWVYVVAHNHGQTPAKNIRYWLELKNASLALVGTLERSQTDILTLGVIHPGDEFTCRLNIFESLSDDEVIRGRRAMYAFGRFEYTDAFNNTWETNLRFQLSGKDRSETGEMNICNEGNEVT